MNKETIEQDYIRRRDHLLGVMKKQNALADKGFNDDEPIRNQAKRGRKVTKPNKFKEVTPNKKMYSPTKHKGKYRWFEDEED
jgi:hypothetical protein